MQQKNSIYLPGPRPQCMGTISSNTSDVVDAPYFETPILLISCGQMQWVLACIPPSWGSFESIHLQSPSRLAREGMLLIYLFLNQYWVHRWSGARQYHACKVFCQELQAGWAHFWWTMASSFALFRDAISFRLDTWSCFRWEGLNLGWRSRSWPPVQAWAADGEACHLMLPLAILRDFSDPIWCSARPERAAAPATTSCTLAPAWSLFWSCTISPMSLSTVPYLC